MHARLNLNTFHKSERKKLYQWGTDVYVADSLALTSWTKVLCISYDRPTNVISQLGYDDMDAYSLIGNSNGTFQVDFTPTIPIMWKKNTPIPSVLVTVTVPFPAPAVDAVTFRYGRKVTVRVRVTAIGPMV